MSELFETQAPPVGWFETWNEPPSFLEAPRESCVVLEQELIAPPLQPIAFAVLGCAVGMIAMAAIAAGVMQGWHRRFDALDKEQLERDRLDGPELPETRR